jgi:hypothetical protein
MSAVNLVIQKGTDFEAVFYLTEDNGKVLNLTNHTAVAKLRKHPTAAKSYSFNATLNISEGSVMITMPKQITSTLPSGRCYYDILITYTGTNTTIKAGFGSIIVEETASL